MLCALLTWHVQLASGEVVFPLLSASAVVEELTLSQTLAYS